MPVDLSFGLVRPDRLAARLDDPSVVVLDASVTLPEIHPTGAGPYRESHIPGSRNLPVGALADVATGRLLPQDALRARFAAGGVDPDRPGPITTTCGSGVTAAALAFGLWHLDRKTVAVSDGSRSEWGSAGLPMARGPAEVPA